MVSPSLEGRFYRGLPELGFSEELEVNGKPRGEGELSYCYRL